MDHPRVCGADRSSSRTWRSLSGTPPRLRSGPPRAMAPPGRDRSTFARAEHGLHLHHTARPQGRITPRRRGGPPPERRRSSGCTVHPRVCGADGTNLRFPLPKEGTPPRMRSWRLLAQLFKRALRPTSARTERTSRSRHQQVHVGFTPAFVGRTGTQNQMTITQNGSPPCMRGGQPAGAELGVGERFTPACAGRTWESFRRKTSLFGSPPRMRGRTVPHEARSGPGPDHPRACGADSASR